MSLMFIILMGDYTWRQYSIDSWHKNADCIYLTGNEKMFYMWPQAAEEIKNQCPEVSNQNSLYFRLFCLYLQTIREIREM